MRPLTAVGVVLTLLGIVALAVPRIAVTTTEEVVDVGPIEVEAQKRNSITIPNIAAGAAIVVGTTLLLVGTLTDRDEP